MSAQYSQLCVRLVSWLSCNVLQSIRHGLLVVSPSSCQFPPAPSLPGLAQTRIPSDEEVTGSQKAFPRPLVTTMVKPEPQRSLRAGLWCQAVKKRRRSDGAILSTRSDSFFLRCKLCRLAYALPGGGSGQFNMHAYLTNYLL